MDNKVRARAVVNELPPFSIRTLATDERAVETIEAALDAVRQEERKRQGNLEEVLRRCKSWLRSQASAEGKLCREQPNRSPDARDAFIEAHNAIVEIIRKGATDAI